MTTYPFGLKIMADHCSDDCLWTIDPQPTDWPTVYNTLPTLLLDDLEAWGIWYSHRLEERPIAKAEIVAFAQIGFKLAGDVKACLPDWRILYFDDAAYAGLWWRKAINCREWLYEIMLKEEFAHHVSFDQKLANFRLL